MTVPPWWSPRSVFRQFVRDQQTTLAPVSDVAPAVRATVRVAAHPIFHHGGRLQGVVRADQNASAFFRQLQARLRMRVIQREVVHYDWNRKCNRQNAADSANTSNKFPPRCCWRHVAVSNRRHGNHSPPEAVGYVFKFRAFFVLLAVIDQTCEEHYADQQEGNEQQQLPDARP